MNDTKGLKEELENLFQSNEKILDELKKINKTGTKWYDIPDACAWLKCSPRTLQNYRDEGLISYSKIGSKIYFREEDLQEFLNRHYIKKL